MKKILLCSLLFLPPLAPAQSSLALDVFNGATFNEVSVPLGANSLLGFGSTGEPARITLGSGLSLTAGTLNAESGIAWGSITGLLSDQTDLQSAIDSRVPWSRVTDAADENSVAYRDDNAALRAKTLIVSAGQRSLTVDEISLFARDGADGSLTLAVPLTIGDDYVITLPLGSGTLLMNNSNLNASLLASGTLPNSRLSAVPNSALANSSITINGSAVSLGGSTTLLTPTGDGSGLTALNASQLTTGTVPNARLSAVPNSALANSSITINGSAVSLGGSTTISAGATLGANTFTGTQTVGTGRFVVSSLSSAAAPALGFTDSGASGFYSDSNGIVYLGGTSRGVQFAWMANGLFRVGYSGFVEWTSGAANGAADLRLGRLAANFLSQHNGANAQRFAVANTHTSATNNEVAVIDWQTATNVLRIGSSKGSGGGSNREVRLIMGDTAKLTLDTSGNVIVSGLPTASAGLPSGALWRDASAGSVIKQVP